ncbi:polysaccharide biosynthesis/export family protein [Spirosoma linguale]|uniref:Soluble ligand binding domain protein n=1 Tax=Spirosoma linguale (strain ATCC 33905 / DSM 74 / LMG 10896 / Claus 1) TaxID=504472 RepID=D2QTY5_SPILD|nr:Soluble ligand binding domain protein [Spirosoma linguale DSM 74]
MTIFTKNIRSSRSGIALVNFCFLLFFFYSCTSTKSVTYFQGGTQLDTARYSTLQPVTPSQSAIEKGDILAIVVTSLSEESNELINFPNVHPLNLTIFPGATTQGQQPLGYMVDDAGNVNVPLVGNVKLVGLTIKDANKLLVEKLGKYLTNPSVTVRQLNYKVTVLGEVNRPGIFSLLDNKTTLPDLLGMAGDLTVYGRRDNVMLIRMNGAKREVIRLDLTSRSVLNSPYFFVQNNDVVYIEPRSGKLTAADRTVQLLPIYLGITSTLLFLANILLR